jgi:hypothetical protein
MIGQTPILLPDHRYQFGDQPVVLQCPFVDDQFSIAESHELTEEKSELRIYVIAKRIPIARSANPRLGRTATPRNPAGPP